MARATLKRLLAEEGYEVAHADTARYALNLCRGKPADLVVVDLSMPAFSGVEVVHRFRTKLPGAKLVVVTDSGPGMDDLLEIAATFGVTSVINKPFRRDEVLDVVRAGYINQQNSTPKKKGENPPRPSGH